MRDDPTPRPAGTARRRNSSFRSIATQGRKAGKARRAGLHAAFTLAFGLCALLLAGCRGEPTEEALRGTIAAMAEAGEARDAAGVVEHLAEDFAGPGAMDRDRMRRTLALAWLRDREVGVALGPIDVELMGDRARAEFTVATRGGAGWLPDRAQVYRVTTGWRLDDGEWKLISADWEEGL